MTFKAHFDGKVIVPDEPVDLRAGESVVVFRVNYIAPSTAKRPEEKPAGIDGASSVKIIDRGKTGADLLAALESSEPIWQDVGDSVEFARELRQRASRRRFDIDPD